MSFNFAMAGNGRPSVAGSGSALAWLITGVVLLRLLLATLMPLTPQEAYYWTWSRMPDWSYFDHPPLASYAIALCTAVFGQTAFGIKSAAVLWSLGWNVLWARVVIDMFGDRRLAFWSLVALNLTLLYEFYGVGPTPDGPLMLGWIGTIWAVWRATGGAADSAGRNGRWWYLAGVFMGIAWLGKYSGVLLVPVVGLYLLAVPAQRHWLARREPWLAIALAVLIFSPVLYWNWQHDWVSLAFQSGRRLQQMNELKPRYVALLLATQFLVLTPYVFGLSVAAAWHGAWRWLQRRIEPRELLLLISALIPLLLFAAASLRTNAKINWLMPAWWSLVILGMRASLQLAGPWRARGLASSALVLLVALVVATVPNLPLPKDLNIWSGWRPAAERIDQAVAAERAHGRRAFVFSPNYKLSSLLWFHRPTQERTYAQNIYGRPALQYDYFPHTEDLRGATGFLVLSDQAQSAVDVDAVIRPLFDRLERVEVVEVGALGRSTRRIEVWRGTGYRGVPDAPQEPAAQDDVAGGL